MIGEDDDGLWFFLSNSRDSADIAYFHRYEECISEYPPIREIIAKVLQYFGEIESPCGISRCDIWCMQKILSAVVAVKPKPVFYNDSIKCVRAPLSRPMSDGNHLFARYAVSAEQNA